MDVTDVVIEEFGGDRYPASLGARVGTVGSQGEVRTVSSAPDRVAKILHRSRRSLLAERLDVLTVPPLRRAAEPAHPVRAAWPTGRVRDARDDTLVGFTMSYLTRPTYRPLESLLHDDRRTALLPASTWSWLVAVAADLAASVARLAALGVVIGDLAPQNVVVTGDAAVTLLDVDGWQVRPVAGGAPLPCPFSRPEYTAPELADRPAGTVRPAAGDRWALAVVVGQILMLGTHPFAGIRADAAPPYDEVANIRAGHSWLLGHPVTLPRPMPDVAALLTDETRHLFARAFESDVDRPAPDRWRDALDHTRRALVPCGRNRRHVYLSRAPRCPWCALADAGHDPFPATNRTVPGTTTHWSRARRSRR